MPEELSRERKRKRRSWTPVPPPNEEQEGEEDVDPILLPPTESPVSMRAGAYPGVMRSFR